MSTPTYLTIDMPPVGLSRHFMLSFLNSLLGLEIKPIGLYGNKAVVETKTVNVSEVLAQSIERAGRRLEEYAKDRKIDIPLTGNERGTFKTLQKDLGLPEGSTFTEALGSYAQILRNYKPQELTSAFSSFGTGDFTPISILKPELYKYTRAPFMKSKEPYRIKLNLDYFMTLIAGYTFSRLGRAPYDIQGGKKIYQTVHLLPYDIGSSHLDFYTLLGVKTKKEGGAGLALPGLRPEEAVILWFSLLLPKTTSDLLLLSIKDPAASKPASIGVAFHLPISSFITRASEKLQKIKENERLEGYLKDLLRKALEPARTQGIKIRERAIEIVKLLFLALQKGNEKERNELLLRASRIEASIRLRNGTSEERSDEFWIVTKGRRLAEATLF